MPSVGKNRCFIRLLSRGELFHGQTTFRFDSTSLKELAFLADIVEELINLTSFF